MRSLKTSIIGLVPTADRWNRDPRTRARVAGRRIGARRGPAGEGTHTLLRAHLAVAVLAGLLAICAAAAATAAAASTAVA